VIFELLVTIFVALLELVADLFGDIPAPGWLTGLGDQWADLVGQMGGLGAWIPWALLQTVVMAVLACVAIGFAIKVGRIVLALFTGGGGSAG
jgi:hypothetical protein